MHPELDELHEDELFHEHDAAAESASDTEEPSDSCGHAPSSSHQSSNIVEINGTHSGSAKSTTLNVVIEDDDEPGPLDGSMARAAGAGRPQNIYTMAQSLPVNMKMGSSVPIAINRPRFDRTAAQGVPTAQRPPVAAGTFIPPHQFSQRDECPFNLMGESPGGAMKRDRLRMRNSILKQTGFLENASLLPGMVAGVGTVGGGEAQPTTFTPVRTGGLAQALARTSPAVTAIYD